MVGKVSRAGLALACLPALVLGAGPATAAVPGDNAHPGRPATATARTGAVSASALPVGAAKGFPFGSVKDEGTKISLLPPTDAGVDQARVAHAPRVGPFAISLAKSFAGWPSACELTDAAQLKEVFPGITGVRGKPAGSRGEVLGSGKKTPHDTQCTWSLSTKFAPQGYTTYSNLQIQLDEIGPGVPQSWAQELASQRAASKKYPAQYANYPSLEHGVKCFDDGNELQCLKGEIDFWVLGQKVTGGEYYSSDQAVWVDQVELPVAELLGAELSTKA